MSAIDSLANLFMKFPGIGTRQAKRFVYFLLSQNPRFLDDLVREIASLKSTIRQCEQCYRFYPKTVHGSVCSLCVEADPATLMVVEKDSDLEVIHKSGVHKGAYFVLGGTVPVLTQNPSERVRAKELKLRIEQAIPFGLTEVVLALSVNPDGDTTGDYLMEVLKPLRDTHTFTITTLGRGLSTGSELEYSDPDTLKHALKNRSHKL